MSDHRDVVPRPAQKPGSTDQPARQGTCNAGQDGSSPRGAAARKSNAPTPVKDNRTADEVNIELLAKLFPNSIIIGRARRPLKMGIETDMPRAVKDIMRPDEVRHALMLYARSPAYLRRLRAGAERVDLAGNPAGVVTAEEAAWAAGILARRSGKPASRRARQDDARQPLPPATDRPHPLPAGSPNAVETIEQFDRARFAAHPGRSRYVRDPLPGEFEVEFRPPPSGKSWLVKVTAIREPETKRVISVIRERVLWPLNPRGTGG